MNLRARWNRLALVLVFALALAGPNADAAVYQVEFSGIVTNPVVDYYDLGIVRNTPVYGFFRYRDEVSSPVISPTSGSATYAAAVIAGSLTIGDHTVDYNAPGSIVLNDDNPFTARDGIFAQYDVTGAQLGPWALDTIQFGLNSTDLTTWSSPTLPVDLSVFQAGSIPDASGGVNWLRGAREGQETPLAVVGWVMTDYSVTPEPGTAVLLASGLIGLASARKRERSQR